MIRDRWRAQVLLTTALLLGSGPALAQGPEWLYTVRPGDTIWSISDRYLVSMRYWQELQRMNQVSDPHRLPPGKRLRVPIAWLALQPVPVTVVALGGEVRARVLREGGAERTVQAGERLHAGDELSTAADANAVLEFADGSRLHLRGGSTLVLDTVSAYRDSGMTDTRLRLQSGRLDTRTHPAEGPATRFQIETPAAVSAVRGTDYRVGVTAAGERALTEVLSGRVRVTGAGVDHTVDAGFGTVTVRGQAPQRPRPLLPAPDLSAPVALLDRLPFQIAWPELAGVVAYRAQVAASERFDVLLAERVTPSPRLLGPDLADGQYWLRVRGIDEAGIEGYSGITPFVLNARPVPPIVVAPPPEATVREPQPELAWSRPEGVAGYRLQIARDAAFQDLISDLDEIRAGRHRPATALTPGAYHWRVASIAADGEQGPFADPQRFTFRPVPPSPTVAAPELAEKDVVFRWSAGLPGQQYRFQLARDPAFDPPLVDRQLSEAHYRLQGPVPGIYYLRVATIDVDGYAGPFGPPQQVTIPVGSTLPLMLMLLFGVLML